MNPNRISSAADYGQQHSQKKASDLIGKSVRGSADDDLGQIRDLVVDPQSGQIRYAIVSTGGVLGIGGTRRAVPFSALSRTGDDGSMMINIEKQKWENSPRFRDDDLATLNQETRAREIYQHFGQNWEDERMRGTTSTAKARVGSAAQAGGLLLVSDLKDKDIRTADQKVGEVEDVLIDADRRTASLLVELEDDFVDLDSDDHYVIGFSHLNVSGTARDLAITTQLTSADFQGGSSASTSVGTDRPYVWSEGPEGQTTRTTSPTVAAQSHPNSGLAATREGANYTTDVTPSSRETSSSSIAPISGGVHTAGQGTVTDSMTGDGRRTGATATTRAGADSEERVRFADSTANPQNRPTVSARENTSSTASAAQPSLTPQRQAEAVRRALQEDSSLRTAARNVEVDARGERLVLSGDVASQEERERVLSAARRAAGAQQIDDQLRVRGAAE